MRYKHHKTAGLIIIIICAALIKINVTVSWEFYTNFQIKKSDTENLAVITKSILILFVLCTDQVQSARII
jgi:hypothetical protein